MGVMKDYSYSRYYSCTLFSKTKQPLIARKLFHYKSYKSYKSYIIYMIAEA